MRYRSAVGAVDHVVADQPPPVALLAQAPAAQPAGDDPVHLQSIRVIAPDAVRLPGKKDGQVDQDRNGWPQWPQRRTDRLAVKAD